MLRLLRSTDAQRLSLRHHEVCIGGDGRRATSSIILNVRAAAGADSICSGHYEFFLILSFIFSS